MCAAYYNTHLNKLPRTVHISDAVLCCNWTEWTFLHYEFSEKCHSHSPRKHLQTYEYSAHQSADCIHARCLLTHTHIAIQFCSERVFSLCAMHCCLQTVYFMGPKWSYSSCIVMSRTKLLGSSTTARHIVFNAFSFILFFSFFFIWKTFAVLRNRTKQQQPEQQQKNNEAHWYNATCICIMQCDIHIHSLIKYYW